MLLKLTGMVQPLIWVLSIQLVKSIVGINVKSNTSVRRGI